MAHFTSGASMSSIRLCCCLTTIALFVVLLTAASARPAQAGPSNGVTSEQVRPWARSHRLSVDLSFSFGYAALGDVHRLWRKGSDWASQVSGVPITLGESSVQLGGSLALRYLGPYHLFAQIGLGFMYNNQSVSAGSRSDTVADIFVLEVPLLLGGYLTLGERWVLHAGAGPAFFVHNTSIHPRISDAVAEAAVGLHAGAGAEVFLLASFSVGVEARFRLAKLGRLEVTGTDVPFIAIPNDPETYDLDMTGFSVYLTARVFIF